MNDAPDPAHDPASHGPVEAQLSPSLAGRGEGGSAFEIKFLLDESTALEVQRRARLFLAPDAFGDPTQSGAYRTTSVYFDTPALDVVHRSPGFRRRKYRLRRYGLEPVVYLERKTRRADRVRKKRDSLTLGASALLWSAPGSTPAPCVWFVDEIARRMLIPVCRMTYRRTAFSGTEGTAPLRLTFDRDVVGVRADGPSLDPVEGTAVLLPGRVICEMKFRDALPDAFKRLVAEFGLAPSPVSKYRSFMTLDGGTGARLA